MGNKDKNASAEGNKNVSNKNNGNNEEVSDAEQKRLDSIKKWKDNNEILEDKGTGPKVKVEGSGEVCIMSCGNCKWLLKKDERGISCSDYGITADLKPCSIKKVGNGFFEPILLTPALGKVKDAFKELGEVELDFVNPMLVSRLETIQSQGITGFTISDKVKWTHQGTEYTGEVDSLTRTHVICMTEKGKKWTLLPGAVKKVTAKAA